MIDTYTSGSSLIVRLQWDPPLDDGGAAITSYQIFVNSSDSEVLYQVVSNEATIVLNSTGEYFIQIRAINCIGVSSNSIPITFTITGIYIIPI